MSEGDSFDSWLNAFSQEVDSNMKDAGAPAPGTPEGRSAQAAFDRWWTAEQQSVTEPTVRFDEPAPAAPPPPLPAQAAPERTLPEEWPSRLEKLADDRARLQVKGDTLEDENRKLRERLSSIQSEIAEFESKLSRSRRSYEDHIQRLEGDILELRRRAEASGSLKGELDKAREAQDRALADLSLERDRAAQADRQLLELRQKLAAQEIQLAQARQEQAAQAGAIEELRKQSSVYQRRLVQSQESTDQDVFSMRQELKTFLEDLRLIRNTMRKGETA
jgi:chromosome segregation ATPase